jgi:hypothetical protein
MNLTLLALQPHEWWLIGGLIVALIAAIYFGVTASNRSYSIRELKKELDANKPKGLLAEILSFLRLESRTEDDNPLKDDPEAKKLFDELVKQIKDPTEAQITAIKQEIAKLDPSYIERQKEIDKLKKEIDDTVIDENDQSGQYDLNKKRQDLDAKKTDLAKHLADLVKAFNGTPVITLIQGKTELLSKASVDEVKMKQVDSLEQSNKNLEEQLKAKDVRINELQALAGDNLTPSQEREQIKQLKLEGFKKDIIIADGKLIRTMEDAVSWYKFYIENAVKVGEKVDPEAEKAAAEKAYRGISFGNLKLSYEHIDNFDAIDDQLTADWYIKESNPNPFFKEQYDSVFESIKTYVDSLLTKRIAELRSLKNKDLIIDLTERLDHPWISKGMLIRFTVKLSKLLELIEEEPKEDPKEDPKASVIEPRTGPKPAKWQDIELSEKEKEQAGKSKTKQDDFKKKLFESWVVTPEPVQQNTVENSGNGTPAATGGSTEHESTTVTPAIVEPGSTIQTELELEQPVQP